MDRVHRPGPWGGPWTPIHVLYTSAGNSDVVNVPGYSHMNETGMFDGNFQFHPKKRPIWVRLKLYLTLKDTKNTNNTFIFPIS